MIQFKYRAAVRGTLRVYLYSHVFKAVNGIIEMEEEPSSNVIHALAMRGYTRLSGVAPKPGKAATPAPGPAKAPETPPTSPTEAPGGPPEAPEDGSAASQDPKPQKAPTRKAKKSDKRG